MHINKILKLLIFRLASPMPTPRPLTNAQLCPFIQILSSSTLSQQVNKLLLNDDDGRFTRFSCVIRCTDPISAPVFVPSQIWWDYQQTVMCHHLIYTFPAGGYFTVENFGPEAKCSLLNPSRSKDTVYTWKPCLKLAAGEHLSATGIQSPLYLQLLSSYKKEQNPLLCLS